MPSDIDRDQYIQDALEKEGVVLDPKSVQTNPALRFQPNFASIQVGVSLVRAKTRRRPHFSIPLKFRIFFKQMHASDIDVQNFQILSKDMIMTDWCHMLDSVPDSQMSNIFVATMTTCWARLRLYSVLELLGDGALYYDTASVIYTNRPDTQSPQTGPLLGVLKSELNTDEFIL